jgi:hypothetical protein|tara:strand:- start:5504 stop:6163 length:660 start_codon:yes stop_codon:yes gene_type:complete
MGNSYTDSKGNTSTSNINNTKSGLPRSQEVDVKKHYTTDGDLHLNKNHVSNSNPHIRDVYSPLQKLSMQALRRYGEFAPESVDGNVLLMFIDFANEIIEDVRVHPYFSDNYEIEYYTHMTDSRSIPDTIMVNGLLFKYATQQASDKVQIYGPLYNQMLNQILYREHARTSKLQMIPVDGATNKSYLQGKEYDTFTGTETSKTDSNSVTAKTGVPTEDTT